MSTQIPAEHFRVLSPDILADTKDQLDAALEDILTATTQREQAYGNKGDLLKEKYNLESRIKLEESQAVMDGLSPDGKTVKWNDINYPFSNDAARDSFRRTVTQVLRRRLAEVEGELAALEVTASQARDVWERAVQAADAIKAKAFLQARLLQFLAGGN